MMKRTSFELKQLAKDALRARYTLPVVAFLLTLAILTGVNLVLAFAFPLTDVFSSGPYLIANLIAELFGILLSAGLTVILMDMSRGGAGQFSDLFYAFRHHPDRVILSQFLINLLALVCMMPGSVIIALAIVLDSVLFFFFGVCALLAGIIGAAVLSLSCALVIPLYIDCPEKSVLQLIRDSRSLMRGNKFRLFRLHLSFLGVALLSVLLCFVGVLWVVPYMEMTSVMFYRELVGEI